MPGFAVATTEQSLALRDARDGRGWPMGCGRCVAEQPDPSMRPCDSMMGGPPCAWRDASPRVLAAVELYAARGQAAYDFGGWGPILEAEIPDPAERPRIRRLIDIVHRVVTDDARATREPNGAGR